MAKAIIQIVYYPHKPGEFEKDRSSLYTWMNRFKTLEHISYVRATQPWTHRSIFLFYEDPGVTSLDHQEIRSLLQTVTADFCSASPPMVFELESGENQISIQDQIKDHLQH